MRTPGASAAFQADSTSASGTTDAGRRLIDRAHADFEAEIAVLVAGLNPSQRTGLSATASLIVAADARRRAIDIFAVEPGDSRGPGASGS